MLEIFSTLLTGVLSGGATGLIGIVLQRYYDLQNKKQELEVVKANHANSLALAQLESAQASARAAADQELAETRAESDEKIANRQAEMAETLADYEGLKAALAADKASYLDPSQQGNKFTVYAFTLVDFFRGLIRPLMTAYLCVLVSIMFFWVRELAQTHGIALSAAQIHELMLQIITTILYVFTTVTMFWYGSRGKK